MVWQGMMEQLVSATRDWVKAREEMHEYQKKYQEASRRNDEAYEKVVRVRNELLGAVEERANGEG